MCALVFTILMQVIFSFYGKCRAIYRERRKEGGRGRGRWRERETEEKRMEEQREISQIND